MSSYELIRLVSRIRALLVNRLLHGDANDLAQDQVPEQWMLISFNYLLAAVRTHYIESLKEAAEDIQKDLVERLALFAVYRSTCESTQKLVAFNKLREELIEDSADA